MAQLTTPQVVALAKKHGFSDRDAIEIAAIAKTESGNVTDSRQPNGMGRGLIQIDLGQHPDVTESQAYNVDFSMEWLKKNGGPFKVAFYGPNNNKKDASTARNEAARTVGNTSLLSRLLDFLPGPEAVSGIPMDAAGPDIGGITGIWDAVKWIPKFVGWMINMHNIMRLVEGLIGGVAILIGLSQLGNSSATGAIKKIPSLITKGIE